MAERVFIRFEFALPLEKLRSHESQNIILTLTQVGIIEFLILSSWCRKNGLPAISVANRKRILFLAKPTFFFQILFRRKTYSQLFLSDEPGPRLLFCPSHDRTRLSEPVPVEQLLGELYVAQAGPIESSRFHFFPIFVLWRKHVRGGSRKPSEYLLGLGSDPNLLGKFWYLIRKRKDSLVKSLDDFAMFSLVEGNENPEDSESIRLARQTRRRILIQTHQEMRVILGPRYSSPENVKETILRDPEIQKIIDEVAMSEHLDRKKVMSRAYGNLTEIVSHYRYRTIEILYAILSWLFNKVFDGVNTRPNQIQMVREQMKTKPVIFVSCHRSHLDYLVIPYILFENDMVTPHIAAGINLAFWPFGTVARSAGAFFIRRSFRGDVLYAACLRKYIEYLLKHRYNIKFFIEGTRSRSGKMLPPAFGLLKMVTEPQRRKVIEDISYVPVSLTYDEVPEERSYTREIAGGQKKKESAKELLKSLDFVKRNFGKVYVRFGTPVSAKDAERSVEEFGQDSTLALQKTAFQLCKNINDATPITPKSVISSVFLGHTETSLSLEEILQHSSLMAEFVLSGGHELSVADSLAFRRAAEQTVRRLAKAGVLQLSESVVPRRYLCDRRRRTLLALYKNNAVHCFIIPSIALSAFLEVAGQTDSQNMVESVFEKWVAACFEMRNWLKFDFFFSPRGQFQNEMEKALEYFFGAGYRSRTVHDVLAKLSVERLPKADDFFIYCRLTEDLFESYLTTAKFAGENPGSKWEKRSLLQRLPKYGEGLLNKKEIVLPESLSVQSYSNSLLLLENLKCLRLEEEGEKKLMVFEESSSALPELVVACEKYLRLMREDFPRLLKPHRSQVLPELHFSL